MKKIIYSTLLILLALTLSTCGKNVCENCYPTVFECKVDGKTWKTSCESKDFFGCTASDFKYYNSPYNLTLWGLNDKNKSSLNIIIKNKKLTLGENKLYRDQFISTYYNETELFPNCNQFRLDTFSNNTIFILEIDTLKQIIKGTFSFDGIDECNNKIKITDGKFDIIYSN